MLTFLVLVFCIASSDCKVSYFLICYIILLWDHTKIHHQTCQKGKARKGRPWPPQILADQLTLSLPGGQIIVTTLLLAPTDFQTFLWPCLPKRESAKGTTKDCRNLLSTSLCPNLFKLVQTCSILSKRVPACSNLFKLLQKFQKISKPHYGHFYHISFINWCTWLCPTSK